MWKLPEAMEKLAEELQELPGIGPRQAIRLAFHLANQGQEAIGRFAQSVDNLRKIKICERCFFVHQNKEPLCDICKNPTRHKDLIAIVEKETDLLSLENTGNFQGRYLVLGSIPKSGLLEPWQKLRLEALKRFINKELGPSTSSQLSQSFGGQAGNNNLSPERAQRVEGQAEEIILAFNPSSEGDFHASLISKELAGFAKKISRLGRGLPTGGEIEFADDETLGSALERRS